MARPSASASADGQCGLKPKFEGIVSRRSSRATRSSPERKRAPSANSASFTRRAARLSPSRTLAASAAARAPFSAQLAQRPLGIEGVLGRERLEVALVDQLAREPAQRRALAPAVALERDAAVEGAREHVVAAGEPLAQPLLPGVHEERVGLGLVDHPEAGQHGALERPLLQDLGAERVDRRDARALEHVERGAHAGALLRRQLRLRAGALQPLAQPQLHGGGRVLGEGDGRDLVEPGRARAHQRLDAVHEQRRLAGAGARLEHQARGVVAAGARARLLVGRAEDAHPMSRSRRYACSEGSRSL